MNVAVSLLDAMAAAPHRAAIHGPRAKPIDCGYICARARALAVHLRELGLKRKDRVAVVLPCGCELAVALLAVVSCGCVAVLLDPDLEPTRRAARIAATRPSWTLVHPLYAAHEPLAGLSRLLEQNPIPIVPNRLQRDGPPQLVISRRLLERLVVRRATGQVPVACTTADDAVIVFSEATPEDSEGVRLSHGALARFLRRMLALTADLPLANVLVDTAAAQLCVLGLGLTAHIVQEQRARRVAAVEHLIHRGVIDTYFGAPATLEAVVRRSNRPLPASLRAVLHSSAAVNHQTLGDLRNALPRTTVIRSFHGSLELGPITTAAADQQLAYAGVGVLAGFALPGVRLAIKDPQADSLGEVTVADDGDAPDHLARSTGMLGQLVDVDGKTALVLAGRKEDTIARCGALFYPGLIEPAVRRLVDDEGPLFAGAVLIGLWLPALPDPLVVLCVQPAAGRIMPDHANLMAKIAEVTGAVQPNHLLVLDELPLLGTTAQIDRRALSDLTAQRIGLSAVDAVASRQSIPAPNAPWDQLPGALIPFDWPVFPTQQVGLWKREQTQPLALKQIALRLSLHVASQAAWAVDEIFARQWRQGAMRGPLFIVGHEHAGKAALHQLLAADRTHARVLTPQELLLPSVSVQRVLRVASRLDEARGGRLKQVFHGLEQQLLGALEGASELRFDAIEEDEFILFGLSASKECAFPAACDQDDLGHFVRWSEERQARTLGYYRACLLKKIFREPATAVGTPLWVVSKNTAFTHKTQELLRVFQDARFIFLGSDPRQAIPARMHRVRKSWRALIPGFTELSQAHIDAILADSARTYLATLDALATLPPDKRLLVSHTELMAQPRAIVESIYRHFDLPSPDAALSTELVRAEGVSPPIEGDRSQALAQLGLTEARLLEVLGGSFTDQGWVRGQPSA